VLSLIREWQWVNELRVWLSKPVPEIFVERHAGEEIAQCNDCHRLLKIRYFNRLIIHLRNDHKLSTDAAIETTTWIMNRVDRANAEHARLANQMGKL
jgi:hypothetical protein